MRLGGRGGCAAIAACLLAWYSAGASETAGTNETEASTPSNVSSESELARLLDAFSRRATPANLNARPAWLEASADRYGELVALARESDLSADWFDRGVEVGRELAAIDHSVRTALEDRTDDREAELEALYSSRAWQRLDYAEVMLDYWRAWAGLSLALKSSDAAVRNPTLRDAERGFTRSALELRLPRVATASLLGLGIVRRELGELAKAQRTLLRLEQQLAAAPDDALAGPAQAELAGLAFARGDIEAGVRHVAQIPPDSIRAEQRTELALEQLEARLGGPDPNAGSRDMAAASIRELTARGGEPAQRAASLATLHFRVIEDRDIGPLGTLLRAEAAFDARDFERARDLYRLVLDARDPIPGLLPDTARYKWARSLSESGDLRTAARELESLVAGGGGGAVRGEAAQLWFTLAERLARETPGDDTGRDALRAARQLVEIAPDSTATSTARLRIARSAGKERERIAALEAIPESSREFPSARLELARLHADAFMRRGANATVARQLALDLDTLADWVTAGRIAAEPARDTAFSVVRAKASLRAGDSVDEVLQWIVRAEAQPGIDASHRRVLLRVRVQAQIRARRYRAFDAQFNETPDGDVARDWRIWHEAVSRGASGAPPLLTTLWYARLERLAPDALRRDVALNHTRALLTSGDVAAALARARDHVVADPLFGDARILLARTLDASGSPVEAQDAWLDVAAGVEPGTEHWLRAQLAAIAAAGRAGRGTEACREVTSILAYTAELDAQALTTLDAARERCPD